MMPIIGHICGNVIFLAIIFIFGCPQKGWFIMLENTTPVTAAPRRVSSVQVMTKIALCVAFCCVAAYLSFPLPFAPAMVTALTLALSVTAFVLTPRQTFVAILIYIGMGSIGLPVFVGGTAGFGRLFGPTGGYITAWLLAYPVVSLLKGRAFSFKRYVVADVIAGMGITYVGGLIQMCLLMHISVAQGLALAVLPFIPGDIFKCCIAAFLGVRINRMLVSRG